MSGKEGSPARPAQDDVTASEQAVLARNKAYDVAKKNLGAQGTDYSKKTLAQLKALVTDKDQDLVVLSQVVLDQEREILKLAGNEDTVNKLRVKLRSKNAEMVRVNQELAKVKQEAKENTDRAMRYADALVDSVNTKAEGKSSGSGPTSEDEVEKADDCH